MKKIVLASAALSLFFGVPAVLAQDNGAQCPDGQFHCASMSNACATGPQCDAADKAKGSSGQQGGNNGGNQGGNQGNNGNNAGNQNFNQGNNHQNGQQGNNGNNFNPGNNGNFNNGNNQGGNGNSNPGNNGNFQNGNNQGGNNGNFNQGNNGPMSDEQMQKQDEQRQKQDEERQKKDEERMKKQQEQQLKQMKNGLKQFTNGLKQMRTQISRQQKTLAKCGIGVPKEVTDALADTDSLITKANASTDFEEFQGFQMDLHERMQVVGDSQRDFGYLQGFCRMLPEGDKMLKRATSEFNKVFKAASRNKDLDIGDMKTDFDTELGKVKAILDQVKQKMTTEPQEAMELMQSDFFPGFEDVFNVIGHIDALANSGKGIKTLDSQLKRVKKSLASLQKKGKDVTELTESIKQFESAVGELKSLAKQKKIDREDLMGAFEDAFSALEETGRQLEEFGIYNPDYSKNFGPVNSPKFSVPQMQGVPQRPQQQGPGGDQNMGPGGFGGPQQGGGDQGFGPGGGGAPGSFQQGPGDQGPNGDQGFGPGAMKPSASQVAKK